MRKYIVPIIVIVILAVYLVYKGTSNTASTPTVSTTPSTTDTNTNTQSNATSTDTGSGTPPTHTTTSTPVSTGSTATAGAFKDGSYTSPVVDAFYGSIQLQAIISGGKLTDITFLQFPNSPGHTTEVSSESLPVLKSQAIAKQSASVDTISGATQTSDGFKQALTAALAMAK